jgi:Universal stress protein family
MTTDRKRRCYEDGHRRKFLMIADETAESETALLYCASRVMRTGGEIVMLHVIEPQDFGHWMGVQAAELEEEANKARAMFRLLRRKLSLAGFEQVVVEEQIVQGKKTEVITTLIDEDQDIAILVLGAAVDAKGPGPLVTQLMSGKIAGSFPIPINVVPGHLTLDELRALA